MNEIPDDCVYEIMRQLGPALIQFRAVSSRFWALFFKNRATLEIKTITFHKMVGGARSVGHRNTFHYAKICNNLLPNKVLRIMDYYFGMSSLQVCNGKDTLTDVQKIKEITRVSYMASFNCPDLEDTTKTGDVGDVYCACYGRANIFRSISWMFNEGWFYMHELKSGHDNREIRHILSKFTVKYFIKGTILEEHIAKDMIGRSWLPKTKRRRRGPGKRM